MEQKTKECNMTSILLIALYANNPDLKRDIHTVQSPHTTSYEYPRTLSEVLCKSDPKYTLQKSQDADKQEMDRLLANSFFAFAALLNIPDDANMVGGRIIMPI